MEGARIQLGGSESRGACAFSDAQPTDDERIANGRCTHVPDLGLRVGSMTATDPNPSVEILQSGPTLSYWFPVFRF
jgi:hypothetical protein